MLIDEVTSDRESFGPVFAARSGNAGDSMKVSLGDDSPCQRSLLYLLLHLMTLTFLEPYIVPRLNDISNVYCTYMEIL